jgi:hypothetical protein
MTERYDRVAIPSEVKRASCLLICERRARGEPNPFGVLQQRKSADARYRGGAHTRKSE